MKVKVKVSQSCPTLCDPIDYAVHEILQARILEWGSLSLLQGGLLNPGIEHGSPGFQADSLPLSHLGSLMSSPVESNSEYTIIYLHYLTSENKDISDRGHTCCVNP